jgi:hypothetical protein
MATHGDEVRHWAGRKTMLGVHRAETISRGFTEASISLACEKQYRSEHPRQAIKTMQLFLHCQHQL